MAGPLPWKSVYRAGQCHIGELSYGIGDAAPDCRAVVVILRRKLLGARGAFVERLLAVPLEHQGGRAPDVDFRYHGPRLSPIRAQSRAKTVDRWLGPSLSPIRSYGTDSER